MSRERPANAVIRPGVSRLPRPAVLSPLFRFLGPAFGPHRPGELDPPNQSRPRTVVPPTSRESAPRPVRPKPANPVAASPHNRRQKSVQNPLRMGHGNLRRRPQRTNRHRGSTNHSNARTRARNLAIHSSDHRLGSQRGAACRARHTFLARYRRVISIDCRKCFFFSHERPGSQPGATSVAVKLQSPAWGRRVQSLSTDGDMAGPPNPSILALEAQAAQSGRSCSEFNRSRPARRVGARHRLIHFFQERTAEQPVLHSFCRLCHLWSGELDRTRKRREFRISCFAEVSFKGIRLSAIAHSTHRADRAGRDSARAFYPTIKRGASQAIL